MSKWILSDIDDDYEFLYSFLETEVNKECGVVMWLDTRFDGNIFDSTGWFNEYDFAQLLEEHPRLY